MKIPHQPVNNVSWQLWKYNQTTLNDLIFILMLFFIYFVSPVVFNFCYTLWVDCSAKPPFLASVGTNLVSGSVRAKCPEIDGSGFNSHARDAKCQTMKLLVRPKATVTPIAYDRISS